MAGFSFYNPNANLCETEELSARLKIYGAELDETFLEESCQALLRARYESGLRYVCLRLHDSLSSYSQEAIQKAALWCEANQVEAMLFTSPGESPEAAVQVLELLDCFRLRVVFENRADSFLSKPDNMDSFFRANKKALLCFNAAEIVSQRLHPFLEALNSRTYRKQLYMVRAHDRCFNGEDALPAHGDAELAEIFSAADGFGRDIWVSVAPYAKFEHAEIKQHMCGALCRI